MADISTSPMLCLSHTYTESQYHCTSLLDQTHQQLPASKSSSTFQSHLFAVGSLPCLIAPESVPSRVLGRLETSVSRMESHFSICIKETARGIFNNSTEKYLPSNKQGGPSREPQSIPAHPWKRARVLI